MFSFGEPLLFDRLYLILLLVAAAYSYHIDKNIFGIFVILFLERVFEESMFIVNQLTKDDYLNFKILVISLCLFACYKLRYDKMIWIAIGALVSLFLAEVYWYFIEYTPPRFYWGVVILFQSLMVRHFIFFRPAIMEQKFPEWKEIRWINTDWQIYQLMFVFVIIELAKIAEYYIRHILGFKDIIIVYKLYPYAAHAVACIIIWIILNELIRMTRDKYLMA